MKMINRYILLALALTFSPYAMTQTIVEMKTTLGLVQIELYPDKAPKTVANFLKYVEVGYYDNLIFHRVIDDWIIQSGGYDKDLMMADTFEPVRNEATNGLENVRGTIAMARFSDPHSADSQFFINLKDNPAFNHRARTMNDYGYTVFGRVIQGMDVADAIGDVKTHVQDGYDDVPIEPVMIRSVRLVSK